MSNMVDFGITSPFWISAAFGSDKYKRGNLCCPLCSTKSISFDTSYRADIFTSNKHFTVDLAKDIIIEESDSGSLQDVQSFVIPLVCKEGHRFHFDLHFDEDDPEDGIKIVVTLEDAEYTELFPTEYKKWK
ncbi:MAG: hypothetical protein ACRYFS_10350 [Janthinobacterium lividum]